MEENTVYLMDCVQGMRNIQDESVDIVICDPPYNIGKDFGNDSDRQPMDQYIAECKEWTKEAIRILKPTGTLYIYGFGEILSYIRVHCFPFKYVRYLIWSYTNKTTPGSKFWNRSHEQILVYSKVLKPHFNVDAVRVPYTAASLKQHGKERPKTEGRFQGQTKTTLYNTNDLGAQPRDVLLIPALAGGSGKAERVDHPTQKPLKLCSTLLKAAMNDTDTLVVVPFAGSGSECVSAKMLGIKYIAFEINPSYITICNDRLVNI